MDGARVAPLMGDYPDADVGVLRMRSLPNFWLHASCDHAVVTRMLPAGLRKTRMRSYWLVHQDAREGADYQLDRLLPFWHLTNEQDWEICKWQQKGRRIDRLRPRPAVGAQGIQRRRVHPLVPEVACGRRRPPVRAAPRRGLKSPLAGAKIR